MEETFSLEEFLAAEQAKDLVRFSTAGSVDDGKSTLIGRLLYDSQNVYEDHVRAVTKAATANVAAAIDFAQLTDGLRAEREQGITIDVAYRYFSTTHASSSLPTPLATSSTPATWPPALPLPTSPSSLSTPAKAS